MSETEQPVTEIEPQQPAPEPAASISEQPEPKSEKTREKWWQVWRKAPPKQPKRPLMTRLLGVGVWGWLKLILLCVLVGFVMLAMQFDPASPEFGARQALGVFVENAIATGRWTIQNGWKPALVGASVVMPIWILWRLITLPFRR